jgi:hypothetical protein
MLHLDGCDHIGEVENLRQVLHRLQYQGEGSDQTIHLGVGGEEQIDLGALLNQFLVFRRYGQTHLIDTGGESGSLLAMHLVIGRLGKWANNHAVDIEVIWK